MSTSSLLQQAKALLKSTFDLEATVASAAPGRVNLIGEHIDYCDGYVMPFALEQNFVIAAAPNGLKTARFVDAKVDGQALISLEKDIQKGDPKWSNYPRGVIQYFMEASGKSIEGFDAAIVSNVPSGGGLSSSAAFELSVATLLEGLTNTTLDLKQKALLSQKAEHIFAEVPCGIMDQFASAFGKKDKLVFIDCLREEPTLIPFENPDLTVIVANTCVSHELSDGGYASRRLDTERALEKIGLTSWREAKIEDLEEAKHLLTETEYRRARHVIGEISRTLRAAEVLKQGDYTSLGKLMNASHLSLRDDFEVSCKELDLMVEIAQGLGSAHGVLGSRMTGGGFGGSTVTLCDSTQAPLIMETLEREYQKATDIKPQIFSSRPGEGARLLTL